MGKSDQFKVRFSGLKPGKHAFEFEVDNSFFEKLEYSHIQEGNIRLTLELDKRSTHMELDFKLDGWVGETCDRCTVGYHQAIAGEYRIFVKFGDGFEEASDELVIIPRETHELDVSHMIYEFIGLSVPLKKVPCDENGDTSICDREILRILEPSRSEGENGNPLWAALKDIKDQKKD